MNAAPKAVSHFGLAAMEARAANSGRAVEPAQSRVRPLPPAVGERPRRTVVRLWLPSTLIFLLLAPFALLLAPFLYFSPRPYSVRPFATVLAVGRLLLALGGTVMDVDTRDALVRIRLF